MTDDKIDVFKRLFAQISVNELERRIAYYRQIVDLKTISEENLREELQKLFSVEIDGKQSSFFVKSDTVSQPGYVWRFYRIRKFEDKDYLGIEDKKFMSINKEQDVWAPPEGFVKKLGRLNRIGESIFYAASQETNAIYETSCNENEFFFLMIYENTKRMRLSQIHVNPIMGEFSALENRKQNILHNFLLEEFTRKVLPGEEYNYKSSIAIFNEFFNSPQIDGFTYPSIKTDSNFGFNICFSGSKAKENLNFCGLMVCKMGAFSIDGGFQILPIYDGFLNENGNFDFYNFNSDIARQKFGHYCNVRDLKLSSHP